MITDVPGVRVGHCTDRDAATGCTVVLLPASAVASGDIRGGAPGTREFELLAPHRSVQHVDAVVLTGGSAFGLAACDGVVRWCDEQGIGFPTAAGPVPIVVGMVIFDLMVGDGRVRPTADDGYSACAAATGGPVEVGRIGAGTGASYAKWRGREHALPGGLGTATETMNDLVVSALVAVNAVGALRGARAAGAEDADAEDAIDPDLAASFARFVTSNVSPGDTFEVTKPFGSTTIGVVATNARLDKLACHLVAQSAHDGLARAIEPAHTAGDGDAFVAAATAEVDAHPEAVRALAARVVERAILSAVTAATT
jgi:L-aminopeptidase/D-esterase-like protein